MQTQDIKLKFSGLSYLIYCNNLAHFYRPSLKYFAPFGMECPYVKFHFKFFKCDFKNLATNAK